MFVHRRKTNGGRPGSCESSVENSKTNGENGELEPYTNLHELESLNIK